MYVWYLKDKFTTKLQSLSTQPHADGKSGEVSQSAKPFWSLAANQRSPEQLTDDTWQAVWSRLILFRFGLFLKF